MKVVKHIPSSYSQCALLDSRNILNNNAWSQMFRGMQISITNMKKHTLLKVLNNNV